MNITMTLEELMTLCQALAKAGHGADNSQVDFSQMSQSEFDVFVKKVILDGQAKSGLEASAIIEDVVLNRKSWVNSPAPVESVGVDLRKLDHYDALDIKRPDPL